MLSWLDAVTDEAKGREGLWARESQRAKEAAAGGGELDKGKFCWPGPSSCRPAPAFYASLCQGIGWHGPASAHPSNQASRSRPHQDSLGCVVVGKACPPR